MSFKRDGDDPLLLNRLKHRRVNDLLGEHVPEDEAKLLSNGRLTCLICSHRPIFDTMKILVIHRKGKKHTAELHKYLAHQQKLNYREAKRIQFESIKKEKELNSKILGSKTIQTTQSPGIHSKKKAIDITEKNPFGISSMPSASSQVRRYLKEMSKKTPLSHVVYQQKEGYPQPKQMVDSVSVANTRNNNVHTATPTVSKGSTSSSETKASDSLLSLHMSGWIRDKFGNLVKDPEAEFDSSEEES